MLNPEAAFEQEKIDEAPDRLKATSRAMSRNRIARYKPFVSERANVIAPCSRATRHRASRDGALPSGNNWNAHEGARRQHALLTCLMVKETGRATWQIALLIGLVVRRLHSFFCHSEGLNRLVATCHTPSFLEFGSIPIFGSSRQKPIS
jgi:hypothetical protein